jgi:FkbM family methyltransferase
LQDNLIRNIIRLKHVTKNWYMLPLYHLRFKKTLVLHFRNGLKFFYVPKAFSVEHFLEEPYKMLIVKDKVVVDIGAYSGDSAIYFSFKGAKKVIAFEPCPFAHTIAKKNVELNKITNVELFNEAIGSKDGNVFLDSEAKGPSTSLKQEGGTKIKMRSLSSLVEKFELSNASLKMDCEGSEVCLLEFDAKVINAFDQIILEYHEEGYEQLNKKLLSCGYKTLFFDVNGKFTQSPPSKNGLIYATL